MYVILIDEYFDNQETPCSSEVEGYFTTKEYAHEHLVNKGFTHETIESWFDDSVEDYYILNSEHELFDYHARIIKLDLIH